jgi:hypothetical protein
MYNILNKTGVSGSNPEWPTIVYSRQNRQMFRQLSSQVMATIKDIACNR